MRKLYLYLLLSFNVILIGTTTFCTVVSLKRQSDLAAHIIELESSIATSNQAISTDIVQTQTDTDILKQRFINLQDEFTVLKSKNIVIERNFTQLILVLTATERLAAQGKNFENKIKIAQGLAAFSPDIRAAIEPITHLKSIKTDFWLSLRYKSLIREIQYQKYYKSHTFLGTIKRWFYRVAVFIRKGHSLTIIEDLIQDRQYSIAASKLKQYISTETSPEIDTYIQDLQDAAIFYDTMDNLYEKISLVTVSTK